MHKLIYFNFWPAMNCTITVSSHSRHCIKLWSHHLIMSFIWKHILTHFMNGYSHFGHCCTILMHIPQCIARWGDKNGDWQCYSFPALDNYALLTYVQMKLKMDPNNTYTGSFVNKNSIINQFVLFWERIWKRMFSPKKRMFTQKKLLMYPENQTFFSAQHSWWVLSQDETYIILLLQGLCDGCFCLTYLDSPEILLNELFLLYLRKLPLWHYSPS